MIILKLGGSVITDKKRKFTVRKNALGRIAGEIKEGARESLIIVHGGGSFGHPIARKYDLQEGFRRKNQIIGVSETRKSMSELNTFVVNALIKKGMPAVAIQPSANIICEGGRIKKINLEILRKFIKLGSIPVLYGDVVLDSTKGFCILSGDQIVSHLAQNLRAEKVILATDVDGVYDRDPKRSRDARLIAEISRRNEGILDNIGSSKGDVTGGIKGKMLELLELADKGVDSFVINALKKERVKKALLGKKVVCTKVAKIEVVHPLYRTY